MSQVKIVSKKDGFRRCGQEHTGLKLWPAGTFTDAQLEQLKRDPMLVVEELPDDSGSSSSGAGTGKQPNVSETVALVQQAASFEELDKLAEGETRKGVLDAITKRRGEVKPPAAD